MVKSSFRATQTEADILFYMIPVCLTLIGPLFSKTPELWLDSLARLAVLFCGGNLVLSSIVEYVSALFAVPIGQRIQHHKKAVPLYLKEAGCGTVCMYIVACFATWPYTQYRRGEPTAFKATLEEASFGSLPVTFYIFKMLLTTFVSDTHTYWKHYSLHHPSIYVFHKYHHVFHNPSTFAGFAIHPVEAFMTFFPIPIMCFPQVALYLPLHLPYLLAFGSLNLYLHCGYAIPFLEWLLPKLYINTSVWHNKHHEVSVAHFGEMLSVWDMYMGTITQNWDPNKYAEQSKAVKDGKGGMDEQVDIKKAN